MDYELMMNGNVRIGESAPQFNAVTTMGNISLDDYKGKWVVLFSHPAAFTPICTTEMIAFAKANSYFEKINTCLIGLSIDSNPSHLAWMYDIYCKTGIVLPFPIIADRNGEIARKYGMLSANVSNTETVRNVYIIDDKQKIRAILVYPMNIGRNISEILRILNALQTADANNSMTPANWMPCEPMVLPMPQNFQSLQERMCQIEKERNGMSWYLSFKNPEICQMDSIQNNCNFDNMSGRYLNKSNFEGMNFSQNTNMKSNENFFDQRQGFYNQKGNERFLESIDSSKNSVNNINIQEAETSATNRSSNNNSAKNVNKTINDNLNNSLNRNVEKPISSNIDNIQQKNVNRTTEKKNNTIQWKNFR